MLLTDCEKMLMEDSTDKRKTVIIFIAGSLINELPQIYKKVPDFRQLFWLLFYLSESVQINEPIPGC